MSLLSSASWTLGVLAAVFSIGLPAAAPADTIPFCGSICFHSSDPTKIIIHLVHGSQANRQTDVTLPRSAAVFVPGYSPSKYGEVPDEVTLVGEGFKYAIVAPEGKPLGEAVEEYADRHDTSLNSAATELRFYKAIVRVRLIGEGLQTSDIYAPLLPKDSDHGKIKALPPFDGLPAKAEEFHALRHDGTRDPNLSLGSEIAYFPESDADQFSVIVCERESHPTYFCEYLYRLNDLVSLEVQMVDFRYHGGRQFVRDRMDMIVRTYCTYDPSCGR